MVKVQKHHPDGFPLGFPFKGLIMFDCFILFLWCQSVPPMAKRQDVPDGEQFTCGVL